MIGLVCVVGYDMYKFQERLKKVTTAVGDLAMKYHGTCTGEHGVGLGKKHLLKKEVGPETYALMQQIKRTLDPNCIMNPHKVFDVWIVDELEKTIELTYQTEKQTITSWTSICTVNVKWNCLLWQSRTQHDYSFHGYRILNAFGTWISSLSSNLNSYF